MTVPYRLSAMSSSLWVTTYFISPALRTAIFGSGPVLCGLSFRPEESVIPISADGDAPGRGEGRCHHTQVTAAAEQAGAHRSPPAPRRGSASPHDLLGWGHWHPCCCSWVSAGTQRVASPEGHLALQWQSFCWLDVQTCHRGRFLLIK